MIFIQRFDLMKPSVEPVKEEIPHIENQISLEKYFKQRRKTIKI